MTDRIIEITDTAARLSLADGLLKILIKEKPETAIPVSEILCLILGNPAVSVSGAALAALAMAGAAVVISGPERLPVSMMLPLCGNYLQTERFHAQITASRPLNKRLWQVIVKEKIRQQATVLTDLKGSDHSLIPLIPQVGSGDVSNVEARASAIYWKTLFSGPFQRDRSAMDNNLLLNYGYSVLRAMTARACCGAGLHPTVGINHHNRYDPYCLADDLMEPFRPVIDRKVFELNPENLPVTDLSKELRAALISSLLGKIRTSGGMWQIGDRIRISAEQVAKSYQTGEIHLQYG